MSWRTLAAISLIAVVVGSVPPLYQFGILDLSAPSSPAVLGTPFLRGELALREVDGARIDLRAPDAGATVVVFYSGADAALLVDFAGSPAIERARSHVLLVAVCVDPDVEPGGPLRGSGAGTERFSIVHDSAGEAARRFGASATPEAFVLVGEGRLCYRGKLAQAGEAVDAVLAGVEPAEPRGEAAGKPLPAFAKARAAPTYGEDVEPILRRCCQACHAPGRSAPFALTSYSSAARRAKDLADVVEQRLMPPWKPASGIGPPLRHDRTLLPSEIATLRAWADAGAPEGPPIALPPAADASLAAGEWTLGTPDLVLEMREEFEIPASGDDVYRCFVLPTNLPEARSITAIEVLPGNPRVVHHTFGYIDVRGLGRSRDESDPGPGYMCFSGFAGDSIFGALGGWTPGNEAHFFGQGIGLNLPRGADVVLQVHYHPSGKVERDRTRLGLHFARTPIRQALQWVSACADPAEFVLPVGDPRIVWEAELTLPMDVELHAMTPHMHLLGQQIEARVRFPDGRSRPLIRIDDWDFNRQDTYYLREPLRLPEGAVIRITGTFDNSEDNPRNPSRPPREIRWGEATTDDMMIVFLALTKSGQDLTVPGSTDDFMEEFFRRAEVAPADASDEEAPAKSSVESPTTTAGGPPA